MTPDVPYDRHPIPTIAWIATQALPSPEITSDGKAGMRWQVTPVLYSFGMYRKLSRWRFFVVEPLTRTSGSLEAFVTPELVNLGPRPEDWFVLRPGLRLTLPLVERGDYLSVSFAAGAWIHTGDVGTYWEASAQTLFGILGLAFTMSPGLKGAEYTFGLRVRYF